jgi:hypothetical protein
MEVCARVLENGLCDGSGGCTTRTSIESFPDWAYSVFYVLFLIVFFLLVWALRKYWIMGKEEEIERIDKLLKEEENEDTN